jgi:16S rRNA (cytosine967-C5)-methyltransferase
VRAGTPFGEARDRHMGELAERDRRLAYELSAGVLRRQAELDRTLDLRRADPRLHDVLRLGAYQLRCLTRIPPHAAVATSVELARETAGEGPARFVNQALRKLTAVRSQESGVGGSHPAWLVRRWEARFGKSDTERLLAWNDAKPVLTLQDPAHALVCRFAAIPPGAQVYDACAAPGGKAVTLEAAGARVVAADARRDRLPRLAETGRRAGVAIRCVAADLEAAPFRPGRLDAVLVDAPCSATGTMARHPDARWRLAPDLFPRAAARQLRLLAAAAPLVRPGGVLIYATCSLEPEENTAVVEEFVSRHPEFSRAPGPGSVPAELLTAAGDFQSLPQRHAIDGAYAARLARRS